MILLITEVMGERNWHSSITLISLRRQLGVCCNGGLNLMYR